MKTKVIKQIDKTFVEQLRDIRNKVSIDIKDLPLDQLKEYFKQQKTLHPDKVWQK